MAMECANGHQVPDGDRFCGRCGLEAEQVADEAEPEAEAEVTCSNLHANPPGTAECVVCGESLTIEVLLCPNGHANEAGTGFCTECGWMIGTQSPVNATWADADEPEAPDVSAPAPEAPQAARWPLWAAAALAAIVLLGGTAARIANGRDEGGSSPAATEDTAARPEVTRYGCKIVNLDGVDATLTDPPHCTTVHLIEEVCGWPLDEIQDPPTAGPYEVRFERIRGGYGYATFSRRDDGSASLTCFAGNGLYDSREWTKAEWSELNRPA